MTDDLVARLREFNEERLNCEPWTCEQTAKQAADEIERLIAELAALRENSLAVLTRVRAYRDKVITERDALRALLGEVRVYVQWTTVGGAAGMLSHIDAALKEEK